MRPDKGLCEEDKRQIVYADCCKMPEKYKPFAPYDFCITIYEDSCRKFTEHQMEILMFHELLHIGVHEEVDSNGMILDWKPCIKGHDLEDFKEIIDRFGTSWDKTGEDFEQITIFEMEEIE